MLQRAFKKFLKKKVGTRKDYYLFLYVFVLVRVVWPLHLLSWNWPKNAPNIWVTCRSFRDEMVNYTGAETKRKYQRQVQGRQKCEDL